MRFRHLSILLFGSITYISMANAEQVADSSQVVSTTPGASPSQGVPGSPGQTSTAEEPLGSFQAINANVDTVLMQYEQLTGKVLIKDSNLGANVLPITISVPQPVPKSELIRIIEASLLLNNIVMVPEGEQVVSYYMPFQYIPASEALTVFQAHILPRAYTSFVPINSAQALLITESTTVIRQLIALQQLIDIPPVKTVSEFVPLVLADAERVADTINKLLDYQRKEHAGPETVPAAPGAVAPQPAPGIAPSSDAGLLASQIQVIADTRTNRILLVGHPEALPYFETLIKQFDAAVGAVAPLEYHLRYISAGEVLPVLQDLLAEDQTQANQGQGVSANQNQQGQNQQRTVNLGGPSGSSSGSAGGYSPVSGSAGSVGAGEDLLQEPNDLLGPQAVIVGRSRIISDAKDNKILVIGPPESVRKVQTILDRLDRRPQQVYLSTVIGQLQLTKDYQLGVDYTQTFKKIAEHAGVASANLNSQGIVNSNGQIVASPTQILSTSTVPTLSGLTIYGQITDAISVFIRALDSRS